jgi:hypothetical protein
MHDRMAWGFWAAATYNIAGMLIFSKVLTNTVMFEADPLMFSRTGCLLVMVWGLAYLAQSFSWRTGPAVSAVFALEKAIFAGWWVLWLANHAGEIPALLQNDFFAGAFYSVYGLGDAAFMVFFAVAAVMARR